MGKCVVARRSDGGGELARRRNKKARDFTHFLIHKYTLLSTCIGPSPLLSAFLLETKTKPIASVGLLNDHI